MSEQLQIGQLWQRSFTRHTDNPDGFINSIRGAIFEITAIGEYAVDARCVASGMYDYPHEQMTGWGIPVQFFDGIHFKKVSKI